jgi:formamidopyrimidine-DNA glycosylase
MPELPEVETIKNGLSSFIQQKCLKNVQINRDNLRFILPKDEIMNLVDTKCLNLTRRAKYMLWNFENNKTLIIHLGMSGRFLVENKNQNSTDFNSILYHQTPLDKKHCHLKFIFEDCILFYIDPRRFGFIEVINSDELNQNRFLKKLGIEPLEKNFNGTYLYNKSRKCHKPIKNFIMDQKIVVGVGNIYASESLWLSHIHPERAACSLNLKEYDTLTKSIQIILQKSIASGGSTLKDYAQIDGKNGYFQNEFSVYNRTKKLCLTQKCTGLIERTVNAGRSTFYCSICQK